MPGKQKTETDHLWNEFISALLSEAEREEEPSKPGPVIVVGRPLVYFEHARRTIHLRGELASAYGRVAESLAREPEIEQVASLPQVRRALHPAIGKVITDHEGSTLGAPDAYIDRTRNEILKRVSDWEVVAPVTGVLLREDVVLQLGSARLIAAASKAGGELKARITDSVNKNTVVNEETKTRYGKMLEAPLDGSLSQTCAVAVVKAADGEAALALGLSLIRELVSALRTFRFAIDEQLFQAPMGMPPDASIWLFPASAFSNSGYWATGFTAGSQQGLPFVVDSTTLDRTSELGWHRLGDIWQKGDASSGWEKTLRSAANWIGLGLADPEPSVAFVKFATVLEMLLCQNEGEERLSSLLAERLAFVLRDDPGYREAIWRRAKQLYGIRSRVVHAGVAAVDDEAFREIRWFAIECFFSLMVKLAQIDSSDALRDFCIKRRFEAATQAQDTGVPSGPEKPGVTA